MKSKKEKIKEEVLKEIEQRTIHCGVSGCWAFPKFIFKSKMSGNLTGYCEEHYEDGEWIERQKLFPEERYWLVEI